VRLVVPRKPAHPSRLAIAGLAIAATGLITPNAPTAAGPAIRHFDVQLAAGEADWTTLLSNVDANLATLQGEATTADGQLSDALGSVSEHVSTQISTALTGFGTGIDNALFGGWYGGDDGYVFGLFGGEPVTGPNGVTETGSLLATLSTDFHDGNDLQAYSDINTYSLELLDHTMKPLLAPLLDETSKGVTTYSIPVELSQIQTNLLEQFGSYTELKGLAETVLSPEISGMFALSSDVQNISTELAAGDTTLATSDLQNLGSDVVNAVVNGYDAGTNPFNGAAEMFPGLLNAGSVLDELYTTWTEQFVTALGSLGTESATVPDFLTGLLSI
jgi:hypothetical protein